MHASSSALVHCMDPQIGGKMFELLHLQYKCKKKEELLFFYVPPFKSKQDTSCSGQKGQIISLESVIEEGGRVKRKRVEKRGRRVWVLSGVMKSVVFFFFSFWFRLCRGAAESQTVSETLADNCLRLKHANSQEHTLGTFGQTTPAFQVERWKYALWVLDQGKHEAFSIKQTSRAELEYSFQE